MVFFAQHDYRLGDGNQSGIRAIGFSTHSEEAYKIFVGNGINILFERALETERNAENILKNESIIFALLPNSQQ